MADASRRRWFRHVIEGWIGATVAVILYPVARFLKPRKTTTSGALEAVAQYSADELKPDAQGEWPAPFNFGGKPCLLIRTPAGEIKAFNAVCTHMECTVKFRSNKPDIFCNCHNGVFDLNGRVVSGPPPRPLEEYRVSLRGTPGREDVIVSRSMG